MGATNAGPDFRMQLAADLRGRLPAQVLGLIGAALGAAVADAADPRYWPTLLTYYVQIRDDHAVVFMVDPRKLTRLELGADATSLIATVPLGRVSRVAQHIASYGAVTVAVEVDADVVSGEFVSRSTVAGTPPDGGHASGELQLRRTGFVLTAESDDAHRLSWFATVLRGLLGT